MASLPQMDLNVLGVNEIRKNCTHMPLLCILSMEDVDLEEVGSHGPA